eukprot:Phypoly_transcript_00167.p1 GENE.Phypoly_transcript_00167~~Phypoly_transcript_00167.p1  ORF type:complete len:1267 (-),score=142.60 Phypoly_transcript_00167:838-4638(-)
MKMLPTELFGLFNNNDLASVDFKRVRDVIADKVNILLVGDDDNHDAFPPIDVACCTETTTTALHLPTTQNNNNNNNNNNINSTSNNNKNNNSSNNNNTSNDQDTNNSTPIPIRRRTGLLGPSTCVALSRTANLGPLLLSDGDVEVEAHCHLGSILATVCVFEGKWQYEATIGTSGIQQIGWAPHSCPFTNEEGVGDSRDSYAFDGNRVAKWHDGSFPYGQAWVSGDVIGCCIDLDNGNITYYRNGCTMGVAFTRVKKGIGYFPAISLSYGERCYFNFGRRPFEYPIETYSPLQEPPLIFFWPRASPTSKYPATTSPPTHSVCSVSPAGAKRSITYLTESLRTLLCLEKQRQLSPHDVPYYQEDIIITASILLEYLAPSFLHEYYVVDIWYQFLISCMEGDCGLVEMAIQWMQLLLERFEWESWMQSLFKYLAYKCRTFGLLHAMRTKPTNDQPSSAKCFPALALVLELLRIPHVLRFAVSLDEFNSHLEHFLVFKQPSKADLALLIPFVWWQGGEGELQYSEDHFLHEMAVLNVCIRVYEDLVFEILAILYCASIQASKVLEHGAHNASSSPPSLSSPLPSSASSVSSSASASSSDGVAVFVFFQNWLTYIITKNKGANRNVVPPGLSPTSVLVNVYFGLLRLLFSREPAVSVSSDLLDAFHALFCKTTEPISEFARLGGTLGHLQKTVPPICPGEYSKDIPLEVLMVDLVVMVYHLGVSSRFKASSQQQNNARQLLARLSEAKKAQASDSTKSPPDDLVASVVHELRLMNYSHAVLVGDKLPNTISNSVVERSASSRQCVKQENMYKITVFLAELITTLSHQGTEFAYMPEYYMESMVDGFHSLRRTAPLPLTSSLSPYANGLTVILCAFICFFNDVRIVNPDVRDLILQSIAVLIQYNEYVVFIENLELPPVPAPKQQSHLLSRSGSWSKEDIDIDGDGGQMQVLLVRGLLLAFDKKFWVTVSSILLRLWKGPPLGIQQCTATESPAVAMGMGVGMVFRHIFKRIASQDAKLLNTFLNNLFNTLNTTISEFSVMKLDSNTNIQANDRRKANFLMELSINLLKILEVVSVDVPSSLVQNELNLTRLVELLLLILIRTTIGPDSMRLDSILVQEPQVSRAFILAPLIGILINLDTHSEACSHALLEALSADASFKIEAFNYLKEYSWPQALNTDSWLKNLGEFVDKLKVYEVGKAMEQSGKASGVTRSASIELCSICYSFSIDTQFEPCKHVSCHKCITRHLLNNSKCFFCNAVVVSTHPCPSPTD